MKRQKTLRERIQIVRRIKSQSIQVSGGHRVSNSIKLVANTIHLDHASKTIVDRRRTGKSIFAKFGKNKNIIGEWCCFVFVDEIIDKK